MATQTCLYACLHHVYTHSTHVCAHQVPPCFCPKIRRPLHKAFGFRTDGVHIRHSASGTLCSARHSSGYSPGCSTRHSARAVAWCNAGNKARCSCLVASLPSSEYRLSRRLDRNIPAERASRPLHACMCYTCAVLGKCMELHGGAYNQSRNRRPTGSQESERSSHQMPRLSCPLWPEHTHVTIKS